MIRIVVKEPSGLRRIVGVLPEDDSPISLGDRYGEFSLTVIGERYVLFEKETVTKKEV